ncbi:MAG: S4 domain-containing protein [Methylococcaceae bacterium]
MSAELEVLRLDKWLWAARFFKTRSLAAEAIAGGKVHVNAQRVKASKEIKIGAQLSISKERYMWQITVLALSSQRKPAKEAVLLYEESLESIAKRQQQLQEERLHRELFPFDYTAIKPNKKDRRLIHRFKQDN